MIPVGAGAVGRTPAVVEPSTRTRSARPQLSPKGCSSTSPPSEKLPACASIPSVIETISNTRSPAHTSAIGAEPMRRARARRSTLDPPRVARSLSIASFGGASTAPTAAEAAEGLASSSSGGRGTPRTCSIPAAASRITDTARHSE